MASKALMISGLVFTILAWICLLIAFVSPAWLVSFADDREHRFVKLGLWEACFDHWSYYKDYLGKEYNGCWWIFSYEYRPIWHYLSPPWFLGIQIVITLTMMLMTAVMVFIILACVGCCPGTKETSTLYNSSIAMFVSAFCVGICVLVFGIKAKTDRQWIERPDQNYLSWAFGFGVLSGFLSVFAAFCILAQSILNKIVERKAAPKERYGGYEMKRAPPKF